MGSAEPIEPMPTAPLLYKEKELAMTFSSSEFLCSLILNFDTVKAYTVNVSFCLLTSSSSTFVKVKASR
jgi:hypothetical protein